MNIHKWLFALLQRFSVFAALCLPFYVVAQPTLLSDYYLETWNSNDGLPHNSVNAITQTEDGYLWFATWEGVARYNGLDFKLFDRSPSTHMFDSGARALTTDSDNKLYVGGARGSFVLRQGALWHPQRAVQSLVNHIYLDDQQNLWLSIQGKGLAFRPYLGEGQYGEDQWVLQNLSAYRVAQDSAGGLFIATDNGLYRIRDGIASRVENSQFKQVMYVSASQSNGVLLGTNNGAWRWDGTSLQPLNEQLKNIAVTVIEEDKSGNIWLGTINDGIARISQVGLEFFDVSKGLPNNRVLSWFEDMEGGIWIGTNGGVALLREAPFVSITTRKGLAGNYVRTILEMEDEQLLVGTSNGLSVVSYHDGYEGTAVPKSQSVLSLAHAKAGGVWVGTSQHGLLKYQDGYLSNVLDATNGLPTNEVRAILEDSQGSLWLGGPAGLIRRTPTGEIRRFTQEHDGLIGNYVMAIAEDEWGKIWIGTGVGVSYLQDGQVSSLDMKELEQAQYAFGFYVEKGYVWIATDRGIVRYRQDDGFMSLVGRPQGLPIDKFFQIVHDDKGYLWLSSNRGIWRIRYDQAHEVADGALDKIEFEHYDQDDGMASSQANGGSNPAAIKSNSGTIYFATAKGVATIDPERLSAISQYHFPVVLESVSFDSNVINQDLTHQVPATINRISLSYVGLGYVMPERLQYRTKLEGFDENWEYRANASTAEYTNLPPGEYTFLLSARYPYGEWQQTLPLYTFTVEPSFWQRMDVRVAAAAFMLLVMGSAIRFRIHKLELNERKLKELVSVQTQELRAQAEKFELLSNEDALTKLPNRRAFDLQLSEAFNQAHTQGSEFYIAIIDIDFFKKINDQYSHIVGDKAVVAIARILAEYAEDKSQVSRWGGEEFTMMYSSDDVYEYFDGLRDQIANSDFNHVAHGLAMTVSIGISSSEGTHSYEDAVKNADHALLKAKRNGRNRVEMHDSQNASLIG